MFATVGRKHVTEKLLRDAVPLVSILLVSDIAGAVPEPNVF